METAADKVMQTGYIQPVHCEFCGLPPHSQPMVPLYKLRQSETKHLNLCLDIERVINGEKPLNHFEVVDKLVEMLYGPDPWRIENQ